MRVVIARDTQLIVDCTGASLDPSYGTNAPHLKEKITETNKHLLLYGLEK